MKNLFLTSSNSVVMHDVIKHIPNFKKGMRLAFIPTAAEVETGSLSWLHADRQALIDAGFDVVDFTVKNKQFHEVKKLLDSVQVVFLAGGNTYFLMQEIRKSECASYFREKVEGGLIYIGSSAGSIVAGPSLHLVGEADDRSLAPDLTDLKGIGISDIVVYPHWANQYFEQSYLASLKSGYVKGHKVVLLTDDQYLWIKDDWYQIMSI